MRLLLLLSAFIIVQTATAQPDVLLGVQVGYPVKIKQAYYHAPSAGMSLEADYKFSQSSLFPYIRAGIANFDVPLTTLAGNNLSVSTTVHSYGLGFYKQVTGMPGDQHYFVAGGGIGGNFVSPDRNNVMISGDHTDLSLYGGDRSAIYPYASLSLQYRSYFQYGSHWFYSARAEVYGLFLANRNNSYLLYPLPYNNGAQLPGFIFWPAATVQIGRTF